MKLKFLLSFIVAFLFLIPLIHAQRILGMPEAYRRPIDQPGFASNAANSKKSTDNPWVVFSDRKDNPVYNKPNGQEVESVDFKEWFYVIDEKDNWVQILKASSLNGLRAGNVDNTYAHVNRKWMKKENLLLWSYALVDPLTKIDRKAFLLNTRESADEIIRAGKKEIVDVFNHPGLSQSGEKIDVRRIYSFYFILKKAKINNVESYLIGLNQRSERSDIFGWVRKDRLTEWPTRFALEPNYENDAFSERKNNAKLRVMAFEDLLPTRDYMLGGRVNRASLIWDNDPVKSNPNLLASDRKRFKGHVLRFPILSTEVRDNYFRTGVAGEVSFVESGKILAKRGDIEFQQDVADIKNKAASSKIINVGLLINADGRLKKYQENIGEAVSSLRTKFNEADSEGRLNIGVTYYRDVRDGKKEDYVYDEVVPLTSSKQIREIRKGLQNLDFISFSENNEWEALYYGIDQTLDDLDFNPNETNILIILGAGGNNFADECGYGDSFREEDYTNVEEKDLIAKLVKANIHLAAHQLSNNGGDADLDFKDQLECLLISMARAQYDKYKNLPIITGLNFMQPKLRRLDGSRVLIGGTLAGQVSIVDSGQTLSATDIKKRIHNGVSQAINKVSTQYEQLLKLYEQGAALQVPGNLDSNAVSQILASLGWDDEKVKIAIKEKYQFYFDAYVPMEIAGASNPCFSQVLFMTRSDLTSLSELLTRLSGLNETYKTPDEKRQGVYDAWFEFLKQYLGDRDQKELENMTLQNIEELTQGVVKQGIGIEVKSKSKRFLQKVKLRDIKSKKVTDQAIEAYLAEILTKKDVINKIYQDVDNYEFKYTSNGNTYYWIPVDYLP